MSALLFDESTNVVTYNKFYNYLGMTSTSVVQRALSDSTNFWIIRWQGASGVAVLRGTISTGAVTLKIAITDMATLDVFLVRPSFYDTDKIIVPSFCSTPSVYAQLHILNKDTLAVI